jgi:DnaJ-class molecular chaperone
MNLQRCFEVLDLDASASLEEARQAHRDIANVWHPDRFSHNPRLRLKAEKKLKEVNVAYETLSSHLSGQGNDEPLDGESRFGPSNAPRSTSEGDRTSDSRDRVEVIAEAGTRLVLGACSFLYATVRQWFTPMDEEVEDRGTSKSNTTERRP